MIATPPATRIRFCFAMLAFACVLLAPALAFAIQPEANPAATTGETAVALDDQQSESAEESSGTAVDEPAELSPYIMLLGRLHQLVVHFPISLLIVALLIEMIALIRKQSLPSTPGLICFSIGAVSAGFAAWFGWINATEIDPSATLTTHRWLGVVTASLAGAMLLIALITKSTGWKAGSRVYGLGVFACASIVGVTGHFGGAMIYGHTYVIEMFLPESPIELASTTTSDDLAIRVIDFETHIAPIIEARCIKCHGPRRSRGDLRLDSASEVFTEYLDEWVIIPGKPDESEFIRLIELPREDNDHMPYKKAVLPKLEIEYLRLWILEGAVWGDVHPSRVLQQLAQATDDSQTVEQQAPLAPQITPAQRETLLTALKTKGVLADPVAEGTITLDINASLLGSAFADADLALLDGLESSVESLNLARTALTDAGSAPLANCTQLRRLYLENTQVGDDTLAHVASLNNLEYLNLYGTRVTDAGLTHLTGLTKLRKVYLWQTGVTSDGAAALREAIPGIEVNLGEYETVSTASEEEAQATEAAGETTEVAAAEEIPDCCASAIAEGNVCDHPCCVEAAKNGVVCETCLGD